MARVFISHSSRDGEPATRIKAWLQDQGFETPFLDFDKHAGIPPGADCEKTLYREIEQSEAIIIIQTPNWMDSKWCFAEYTQARALGKAIFPVIETPTGETLIAPEIQALNLLKDREGGLEQLSKELTRIALDAQGGFPWDSSRPPYPGLSAFQEEDAALYFGRDDDIRRLIERLNARRAQGGTKLVALLGASGSGKSSLLRAGVIPRIKRDRRNWIVLPPMRPQTHPVDELARVIAVALKRGADWRSWRDQLSGDDLARTLSDLSSDLRMQADANEAQILIPIDQGEELFGASDPAEADRFFEILNVAMSAELPFLAVLAQRSDFLEKLQSAEKLTVRFEEFSLGPLPLTRIPQIIEGPARVAGLGIDDGLVLQAAKDAETEDALPLLAFALRELFDRYGGDNHLSLEEYHALGDPKEDLTPLENAVRKAADDVLAEARPGADELTALREAFVPAMVRVNDKGEYVRRPAQLDDLPAKAHPTLERLAKARLLVISQEGDGRMVEVAHEALLRKWPRLREWLDDAREFLTGKQQLERDLHDWESAAENDKTGALLTGLKLNRARGWLLERPHQLASQERAFIQASIGHAEAEERRKARTRRIITASSVAAAAVLAIVAIFAGFLWLQAKTALANFDAAQEARAKEQLQFVWSDLGSKQQEVLRLTDIAEDNRIEEDLILDRDWEKLSRNCSTSLFSGFRYLYCTIRDVVSFEKIQAISGVKVFLDGGPHDQFLDFNNDLDFGRYNPEFLTWLEKYLITEGASENQLSVLAYKSNIGPLVRALYHSHQILFADDAEYQAFEKDYEIFAAKQDKSYEWSHVQISRFGDVLNEYQERLASGSVAQWGEDGHMQERFRWLSDYLAAAKGDNWYLANTAGGFWVRRKIDGTEEQIFELVKMVLRVFEPDVLQVK